MALHGHAFHVSLRTPGWLSAYVMKVFCGNGDVFNRLRHDLCNHKQESVTVVHLWTARGILEMIHVHILKPSFEQREDEIIVVAKRQSLV